MLMRVLDRLEETIISVLIALATLLIFAAVVQRYGLSSVAPLIGWGKAHGMEWVSSAARAVFEALNSVNMTWAQELCIYMFVWMAKFGAAYGVRTGIHVGVDVLLHMIQAPSRNRVVLFGLLSGALFTGIIGTLGANFVWHIAYTDQTSPDLELPMWIVYLAVPLGSYLMCFRFLEVAWSFARTGELPHHDHGHVEGLAEETGAPATAAATPSRGV
ncbi:MAG: TRAP transporter small permease [Hyphomicrobiaceae bacterium]|nr:MAG: TRAP transporter small permease [Hyphomicrobiaceae bacterium]